METALITSLPCSAFSDTTVQVVINGVRGELYSARVVQRGKNKGLLEVILYGQHLGNARTRSQTFFLATDATCEVI
jgi:hypothetical protein